MCSSDLITGNAALGDDVSVTINKEKGDDTFYVRVAGQDSSHLSTGGYALIATLDARLQATQQEIDSMSSRIYRFVQSQRMRDYFEHGKDPLEVDDLHVDDSFASAMEVKSLPGFVKSSRYDIHGSISSSIDVDYYSFHAADTGSSMQIAALSRDLGSGVIPELQVFDATLNPVPATRLINGGGETAIQVHQITNGATYYLRVAAAKPGAGFDQGNYDVSIGFQDDAVQLPGIARGDLTATTRPATLSL